MAHAARKREKVTIKRPSHPRAATSSKKDAAGKMASMIEAHMTDLQLSETEKDTRVARFGERVDRAIASRARS